VVLERENKRIDDENRWLHACIKNTQNRIASFKFIIKNRNRQIAKLLSESEQLTSQ
ncbi:11778_t:CDS:1, partial [Gigaspora margarita]